MTTTIEEKRETFTPGPWIVKHDKRGLPYVGVKSDPWTYEGTVATVEQEQDARLIAAAPEMHRQCRILEDLLEVLQEEKSTHEMLSDYEIESHDQVNEKLSQLREILAKVEGETS